MTFEDHKNYNCRVTTDSGEEYRVYGSWLHNTRQNFWQGWECEAGITRLYIDKNFEVYDGECMNLYLGNALSGFDTPEKNVCKRQRCTGCVDDLIVTKQAPT